MVLACTATTTFSVFGNLLRELTYFSDGYLVFLCFLAIVPIQVTVLLSYIEGTYSSYPQLSDTTLLMLKQAKSLFIQVVPFPLVDGWWWWWWWWCVCVGGGGCSEDGYLGFMW